nr:MAG TPA: hypothetical protein [Caudoviricetes sp.]
MKYISNLKLKYQTIFNIPFQKNQKEAAKQAVI